MLYDSVKSCGEKVTLGVPQGSILRPLLFGIMINDFHQVLYKKNTILYADNTVFYCAAKNSKDIEYFLNHDLRNIENWLGYNDLYINIEQDKTEYVLYGSSKNLVKQPEVEIKIYDRVIN